MFKNYNVSIEDNGAGFLIVVRHESDDASRFVVAFKRSLGDAWRHIQQMYEIENQIFYVKRNTTGRVRVDEWIEAMKHAGYLE